jgi:hypothetical protein
MSDTQSNVSPVRSPEYLAPLTPPPAHPVPDPNRLCSHDGACGKGDAGCYRSDIMIKLESEFGFYVSGSNKWYHGSMIIAEGDYIYYYKPELQRILDQAKAAMSKLLAESPQAAAVQALWMETINSTAQNSVDISLDEISSNIRSNIMGMPPFVAETASFYKFANICNEPFDISNVTGNTLAKIRQSFDPRCNTYMQAFDNDVLYTDTTGTLYSLSVHWFTNKFPNMDFGCFINSNGKDIFYPFSALTPPQQNLIDSYNSFEASNA